MNELKLRNLEGRLVQLAQWGHEFVGVDAYGRILTSCGFFALVSSFRV